MSARVSQKLLLIIALAVAAKAASITIPANLYGHMNQIGSGICEDSQGNNYACGPTATVNSFRMLDQKWGALTGATLIPDSNNNGFDDADLAAVAGVLADEDHMKCSVCQRGTTVDNLISGKTTYLNAVAPGQYYVHDQQNPTFDWFFNELTNGQDIEVLFGFFNGATRIGGHYVTLNGVSWTDTNNNGVVDPGEGSMDFIDPEGGVNSSSSLFKFINSNRFGTDYGVGDTIGGQAITATVVEWGIAESPIPEPATVILIVTALGFAAVRRIRSAQA